MIKYTYDIKPVTVSICISFDKPPHRHDGRSAVAFQIPIQIDIPCDMCQSLNSYGLEDKIVELIENMIRELSEIP